MAAPRPGAASWAAVSWLERGRGRLGRSWLERDRLHRYGSVPGGGLGRDAGGQGGARRDGGDRDTGRHDGLDRAEVAEQGYPVHGGALHRGRRAGRPQRRQQQRRLAQVRPAAVRPVPAVSARCDRAEFGDEGDRVGRPLSGVLGHPRGHQRPQRLGQRFQRHRLGAVLAEQLGGFAAEGRRAGKAFVEGGRGRVDVTGRAGGGAGDLFRRRVAQGARGNRVITGAGRDAKIGQLADPVRR